MSVLYGLVPAILVIGFVMVLVLFWAIRSGQYDDMEGPASRILMDDDDPKLPWNIKRKIEKKDEPPSGNTKK